MDIKAILLDLNAQLRYPVRNIQAYVDAIDSVEYCNGILRIIYI